MVQSSLPSGGPRRYNDPSVHGPVFFRALDGAVARGWLSEGKARELQRSYKEAKK